MKEFFKKFLDVKIATATITNILGFILMFNYINQDQFELLNTLGVSIISILSQTGIMSVPNSNKNN